MSGLRQVLLGILAAVASSVIVIGSMLLALAEGGRMISQAFTSTPTPTLPRAQGGSPQPTLIPTQTPTVKTDCDHPSDWVPYEVTPGESFELIAQSSGIPVDELLAGNCLTVSGDTIIPNNIVIQVPPTTPTPTITPTPTLTPSEPPTSTPRRSGGNTCQPRSDWTRTYVVKSGDTLYGIARAYSLNWRTLMRGNCLANDKIITGQRLRVPNVPTITPKVTATPRPTTQAPPPTTQPPPTTEAPPPTIPPPPTTEAPPPTVPPPPTTMAPPPLTVQPIISSLVPGTMNNILATGAVENP